MSLTLLLESGNEQDNVTKKATIKALCSWAAYNIGIGTFDESVFDGTDTFAVSRFDSSFLGPYDNMSSRFRSAQINRGRNDNQTRILRGTCNATFVDADSTFNQANAASPLAGLLEDRLHPFYLLETKDGVDHPLFYGWVEKVVAHPGRKPTVELQCVDLFFWLDDAYPVIASTGQTTTGAAIGLILDTVGFTDPDFRDLAIGDVIPDFSADGTISATQLIENLLEPELGIFFPSANGTATYRDRGSRWTPASVATIVDTMKGQEPTVDFSQIVNRAKVIREPGGYTVTKTNDLSADKAGWHDASEIDTAYLISNSQADDLALWQTIIGADPKPPMRDLTIDDRTDAQLTQILLREIGHRITIQSGQGNVLTDQILEGISLAIDPAGDTSQTATWNMSAVPSLHVGFFDDSAFDDGCLFIY